MRIWWQMVYSSAASRDKMHTEYFRTSGLFYRRINGKAYHKIHFLLHLLDQPSREIYARKFRNLVVHIEPLTVRALILCRVWKTVSTRLCKHVWVYVSATLCHKPEKQSLHIYTCPPPPPASPWPHPSRPPPDGKITILYTTKFTYHNTTSPTTTLHARRVVHISGLRSGWQMAM